MNPAWMCFGLRPTAVTCPPTESFLPVEIMWVSADEKMTRSSITSQEWKKQFFVTLFNGCHNIVHGSYRMSHYSDSALLCVMPRFDCRIHYITSWIYVVWKTSCKVEPLSLQCCPVWRDYPYQYNSKPLWSWAHLTCTQVWSSGKVTWVQSWRWIEMKKVIPRQLCLFRNCCVQVGFIQSAAWENPQKWSVDISQLPFGQDVTLSGYRWSSQVNLSMKKKHVRKKHKSF